MKSKTKKRLVLLLIFTLLLSACGGTADEENNSNTSNSNTSDSGSQNSQSDDGEDTTDDTPEVMVVSVSSLDLNLDPATVSLDDEDSLLANSYLYEGLVAEENGVIVPALAASWEMSDDGLDYIFTLRGNASFSDGTPVIADTILANFDRWFDVGNPLHGSMDFEAWTTYFFGFKGYNNDDGTPVSTYDGIEKVDQLTVIIHLNQSIPECLEIIAKSPFSILNPDTIADYMAGGELEVVTTGPYVVSSITDSKVELVPNPNYWGEVPQGTIEFVTE